MITILSCELPAATATCRFSIQRAKSWLKIKLRFFNMLNIRQNKKQAWENPSLCELY
jgi:hypothetical protein